jgi:hypothetical protein
MSKISQKNSFEATLIPAGFLVILVGLLLLATTNQWIGLSASDSWPVSILIPGLIMLTAGLRAKKGAISSLLIFSGTLMTAISVFFFMFTFRLFQWSDMRDLWPTFILAPGVAFLASHWTSERKTGGLLISGVVLTIIALIAAFLLQVNDNVISAKSIGPILVISAGISLVVVAWLRKTR